MARHELLRTTRKLNATIAKGPQRSKPHNSPHHPYIELLDIWNVPGFTKMLASSDLHIMDYQVRHRTGKLTTHNPPNVHSRKTS
jgi:hypothetical protein